MDNSGDCSMLTYCVLIKGPDGSYSVAHNFKASGRPTAVTYAVDYADKNAAELWVGSTLIERIKAKQ
jgi:hypothetical protein